jgi:hypothetical protein
MPLTGSFQDAVMQEVLFRERNLRFVEVSLVVASIERLGHLILDGVLGPVASEKEHKSRHAPLAEGISMMLEHYEAELYQDRYRPAYQQAQALRERRAKFEDLKRRKREADALKRVEAFSHDDEPNSG